MAHTINTKDIAECIEVLTTIKPEETITPDRYELRLGRKDPLEMGYDKSRRLAPEEQLSRSAHIRMLQEVCEMMKLGDQFIEWCQANR